MAGAGPGQFSVPTGVATDSTDRIIVADRGNNRIQVFNSAGVFQSEFGVMGAGPGQFSSPFGVATDSTDRIIVADRVNNRIQIFAEPLGDIIPPTVTTSVSDTLINDALGGTETFSVI